MAHSSDKLKHVKKLFLNSDTCGNDHFRCPSTGICVFECDGKADCVGDDAADEANCGKRGSIKLLHTFAILCIHITEARWNIFNFFFQFLYSL